MIGTIPTIFSRGQALHVSLVTLADSGSNPHNTASDSATAGALTRKAARPHIHPFTQKYALGLHNKTRLHTSFVFHGRAGIGCVVNLLKNGVT